MSDLRDVVPVNSLKGMSVLSLATGNKLGHVGDVFIDPLNGLLSAVTVSAAEGTVGSLEYDNIYSFGRDAIMASSEESVVPVDAAAPNGGTNSSNLTGTKVITESGEVLGRISNIFVTLKPPPVVLYEIRQTLLDKLLGRGFYIPASAANALSDDFERLLVPESAIENAAADVNELLSKTMAVVRSFSPPVDVQPIPPADEGDETVVRLRDEDETVVRLRDEDDTVVRRPRKAS